MNTALSEMRSTLAGAIADDGGVAWKLGEHVEVEPTALTALALGEQRCVEWLLAHQHSDGGFRVEGTPTVNTSATSLAALALPRGDEQVRALDRMVADRSRRIDSMGEYPLAWGWTTTTYSWVEPTARVLLALRLLRPDATADIDEGVASLAEREVEGGGWNYGNADVRGTDLKPYAQTTAVAVMALHGLGELADRGVAALHRLAPVEPGGLSLAQSIAALRLAGDDGYDELVPLLASSWATSQFLGNLGTAAWALLATGDRLEQLQVGS